MQKQLIVFLTIVAIAVAACAQQQQVVQPTAEPILEATTEVPVTPATATPIQRATLPPTWTPLPESSSMPLEPPTATTEPPIDLQSDAAVPDLPEACDTFGPDENRLSRTYRVGEDVPVYWTPVEGAEVYSVSLTGEDGNVIFTDYTAETGYVFASDLFEDGALYGWQAHPVDNLGQQMCFARGAELFPEFLR